MTAPAASVAAVMQVLLCKRQPAFNRCAVHEFRTWEGQWTDRGCPVAVAAADAAVEAATPGIQAGALREAIIHIRGFGDVSGVEASLIVGNLADVANGTIDAAQAHGHDVKRGTVRDLNGWLREARATITVDPDHPMWHRFLRPSDEWPRADRIEPRP